MKIAEAWVEIRTDSIKAEADVKKQAQGLGATFAQVFGAIAFGAGLKKAIDAGSRLEQSVGAIESVFGKSQKTIDSWAKGAAKSMGMSEAAARESLSIIGAQLKNFGFSVDQAADKGMQLVQLGADMAATFGGTTADAVSALTAALRGEMDPIERYGVSLNDVRLKAKALELGLYSGTGALDANAKANASLALIMEQTASSAGQFSRELDTVAGRQAVAAAEGENTAATFGQRVAPIYERLVEVVTWLAEGFGALPAPLQYALIALAAVAALSGPVGALKEAALGAVHAIQNMGTAGKLTASALGALGVVLTLVSLAYGSNADAKKRVTDYTNDLVAAMRAEREGHKQAVIEKLAEQLADEKLAEASNKYGVSTRQMADWIMGKQVPALDSLVDRYHLLDDSNRRLPDAIGELMRSFGMTEAEAGNFVMKLTELHEAYDSASSKSKLQAQIQQDLGIELDGSANSAGDLAGELEHVSDALADLLGNLSERDAYRNVQDSIDGVREAYAALFDKDSTKTMTQRQRDLAQAIDDTKRDVISWADEVGNVPAEKVTEIMALIDEGQFDEANRRMDEISRARTVQLAIDFVEPKGTTHTVGRTVKSFAAGGYESTPTPAIVGHGPEAILPLTNPDRMRDLLGDPRIGGPVAAAMGGGITIGSLQVGSRADYDALDEKLSAMMWRVA